MKLRIISKLLMNKKLTTSELEFVLDKLFNDYEVRVHVNSLSGINTVDEDEKTI